MYSIVRPLTHRIVSGNLSQARSWFFEVKIARSDRDAVYLPSHFNDILDARKQIQIKSLKVDAISFSIAETTPSSVTVDGFMHASVQIKRGTLERWLLHDSISHIIWRQVVWDRTCVYSVRHFLDVTSPDPERVDVRRLRIDYIKPSCFNRRGRPRLVGGGNSELGRPAGAGAGRCRGRCATAAAGNTAGRGANHCLASLDCVAHVRLAWRNS